MSIENDGKEGWDFKGKMLELVDVIIETIKDATGLNWMLDNGLNKMCAYFLNYLPGLPIMSYHPCR